MTKRLGIFGYPLHHSLSPLFQQAALDLSKRGVLLAIASKNNASDVDEIFARNPAMVLKPEHFSAKQIHWGLKSHSLERIAKELNLDLEHVVFVDNNAAECAEVAEDSSILVYAVLRQFTDSMLIAQRSARLSISGCAC